MATSQFSAFKEQLRLLFKTYSYLPTSENVVGDDTGLVHVLNEDGFKSVIYSINTRENLFSAFMGEESSENDELTMNNVLHQLGTDSVLRKLWHQMVLGQYPNWEKLTYEEKKRVAIPWNAFYQPFLSFLHESLHVYMHPDLLRGGASPRPREAPFTPRRQAMFNDAQPLTPNDNGKYFRTPRRNGPHPGNSPNTLRGELDQLLGTPRVAAFHNSNKKQDTRWEDQAAADRQRSPSMPIEGITLYSPLKTEKESAYVIPMEEEKSMPRLTIMREEDMPSWSARRAVADVNRYEREYSVKSVSLPARSTIEIEVDPLALPSESEERHDSQSLPRQRERSPSDSISVSDEETEEETKKRTETPPLEAHDEEMEAERPSVAPPRYVDAPRLYTTKGAKAHHGGKKMTNASPATHTHTSPLPNLTLTETEPIPTLHPRQEEPKAQNEFTKVFLTKMQPITNNNNNNSRLSMIRGGQRDPSPPSQPPLLTPPRSKTKEDKEEKQEEEEHSTNRDSNRMNDSFVEEGRKTTATKVELSEHYDPRGDYTVREVIEKASPSPIRQDEGTSVADDHTNSHQEEVPPTVCSRLHSAVEMPHSVGTVLLPSAPAPSMTPLTPCEDSFRNSSHANSTLPSPRASAKLYQVRYQIRKEEEEKKEEPVNVSSLLAKYIHPTQAEDTNPNTNDKENGALRSNKVTGVPRPLANNDKETTPVHAHRHRHHSSRRHRKSSTDHKPRSTEEDTPTLVSPPVEEAEVVSLTPLRDITALLPRPVNTPLDSKTPNRGDAVLPAGGSPPPRLSRRARYTSADKRRSRNNSANPPTLPQRRGPGSSSPASHGDTPVRS